MSLPEDYHSLAHSKWNRKYHNVGEAFILPGVGLVVFAEPPELVKPAKGSHTPEKSVCSMIKRCNRGATQNL